MKSFSKLVLVIFSVLVLILGVVINLLIAGWLDFDMASKLVERALTESPANKIILAITEISMLFAIICIFADTTSKKDSKGGRDVLMQNDNGRLMISRETIENIVNSVVKDFPNAKCSNTKIALDNENNISVLVDLAVTKDVVIKELTINMQDRIKDTIKKTSDLEVSQVNVRIKNIIDPEDDE